nr:hypothetical protein [Tanacetum cinerariifolium]
MNTASSSSTGLLPRNIVPNPREDLKAITNWSGVTLAGPSVSPPPLSSKEVDREPETITDQVLIGSTNNVPPLVVQPSPTSTFSIHISFSKMPEVTKDTVQPSTKNIQPPLRSIAWKAIKDGGSRLEVRERPKGLEASSRAYIKRVLHTESRYLG